MTQSISNASGRADSAADLRQAYGEAAHEVEATPDPADAFTRATALVRVADEMVGQAANLRARMVRRLADEERLSLAQLAARIGASKSRADQLLRAAKAADDE